MKRLFVAAVMLPSLLSGCSLFSSFLDSAMDSAGSKAGSVVGDRIGMAVANRTQQYVMSPEMTQAYAMGLFTTVYYFGGYTWQSKAYKPGEYTVWQADDVSQGDRFEKAFLKKEPDGKEWWRVRSAKQDGSDEAIVEALFSAPDRSGMQQVVRMRAKFPGQDVLSEVPITAENRDSWVLRPASRLSPESLEGAMVGIEPVKVPAGLYRAKHVRFAHGAGHIDWWLSDEVPGGVVKYSVGGSEGLMQLIKVGTGAKPTP